jgi:hypothetical protein
MSTIQINRTLTGAVPGSLAPGELYIDQLNGLLYWADATGVVHSSGLLVVTASQMPAFSGDVTTSAGSTVTAIAAGAVTLAKIATSAIATAAQFLNNTASLILTTDKVWSAAAFVPVSYAASISLDFSTFINASITLTGNMSLSNPVNGKAGQAGSILLTQDGSGSRTLSLGTAWKAAGGVFTPLSVSPNAVDRMDYFVVDSTHVHYSISTGVA